MEAKISIRAKDLLQKKMFAFFNKLILNKF